jgi:aspartate/methionine/tyrosine aminotransferase
MGNGDYSSSGTAFRPVPRTGVIFVTEEARRRGYAADKPGWLNLGQGQPETGALPGAPERITTLAIHDEDNDYAPVAGLWELREAVANFYNETYRQGMASKYKAENVAIAGGGRAALTRAAASIAHVNLGHFLPDYTAYEELLDIFRRFNPIPILLDGSRGYGFTADDLRAEILGRGLGAILLSNPCNPTGKAIWGEELSNWVNVCRELECACLLDEFYSHYFWMENPGDSVSAARYVNDVDKDPIVLFNGLTKNWRYPGWRVSWAVGPRLTIEALSSAGSFLDGGGSRPLQRAAMDLIKPAYMAQESRAIHEVFKPKRDRMLKRLRELGITFDLEPEGTFYAWGSLSQLPGPLQDGMAFFREALAQNVIVVPGEFFDVNPGKRRPGFSSRFRSYVRFSFGPEMAVLDEAIDRLAEIVSRH